MICYHGLPITPSTAAHQAIQAGHAFVSYPNRNQLSIAVQVAASFAIDNGAFGAWKAGKPVTDWTPFYTWAKECQKIPSCDFAVIPDVIDGTEEDNDALLADCPLPYWFAAPVWHMHESFDRLQRLAMVYPRLCIGSSGDYSVVGNEVWWRRMGQVMRVLCNEDGQPSVRLHGLRMLNPAVFSKLPFASADSTNIGRNVGIDKAWKGTYLPPTKEVRAAVMRQRIEAHNAPAVWNFHSVDTTQELFA
jgi:hypothetical protein